METLIDDVFSYINNAIRFAVEDPAATLLVFMFLALVILTPGRKAAEKALMALVICYIYLILTSNVLARGVFNERKYSFELFSSGRREMVENVLLFTPLGMLLCAIDLKTRPIRPWKNEKAYKFVRFLISMAFALLFTCIIEGLQLYLLVGVFTVDDILCNATGALLGYGFIFIIVLLVRRFGGKNGNMRKVQSNERQ
ncbi:MAG: VanZ family protein [Clostridiales bacterium]|nr:VanZ family protein [Clostridiales bacterium]